MRERPKINQNPGRESADYAVKCPYCGVEYTDDLDSYHEGEVETCDECGATYRIAWIDYTITVVTDPVSPPPEEAEDERPYRCGAFEAAYPHRQCIRESDHAGPHLIVQ